MFYILDYKKILKSNVKLSTLYYLIELQNKQSQLYSDEKVSIYTLNV